MNSARACIFVTAGAFAFIDFGIIMETGTYEMT